MVEFKNLFSKLLIARQLTFEEGKISLLGQSIVIVPTYTIAELQKFIEEKFGKNGQKAIYLAAKEAGKKYVGVFKKQHNPPFQALIDWCVNIMQLSGWGKFTVINADYKNLTATFHVVDSPITNLIGKRKEPVDFFISGFLAGGTTIIFNQDFDVKEIKCTATGNQYCEFEAYPSKK